MSSLKIAVLGTGLMGYGMAMNIAKSGHQTSVWNRTQSKANPLSEFDISIAPDAASAVSEADIVVTMLIDAQAVKEVMNTALPALKKNAIWLQCSTVGLEGTLQLAAMAKSYSVPFFDSPVLGSKDAAEDGSLIVVSSGPSDLKDTVTPVFEAIGSRIMWMGENPNDAHRLKLVMQSWALSVTAAVGQAFALAQNLGTDPDMFLSAIKGGAQDCPYAHVKGAAMKEGEFPPAFTIDGAVKDASLVVAAMSQSATSSHVMQALHDTYLNTAANFDGREDMGAIFRAFKSDATDQGAIS
ncbi:MULTISPECIES: NAD(P)-dependent oxidoreductase [Pseudomonas syringae group]|uniref:NAD(P)-dependent oxidoreductase n=1 Tax=Pseudomonas syringae group TaxID=136849 RepID=UPI0004069932|nr:MULTISPECIES: NAD(P)-dependent oxidoreductase [Pseudomonas syringae group]KPW57345.1 3-hydroxyisobutyrate dehydrogenase [Pseudomonas syringae pv. berberidis]RMP61933.1 3-hydroxyisobutyrate dehydrogenase [Pseudomonas syringae pv. berberidis]